MYVCIRIHESRRKKVTTNHLPVRALYRFWNETETGGKRKSFTVSVSAKIFHRVMKWSSSLKSAPRSFFYWRFWRSWGWSVMLEKRERERNIHCSRYFCMNETWCECDGEEEDDDDVMFLFKLTISWYNVICTAQQFRSLFLKARVGVIKTGKYEKVRRDLWSIPIHQYLETIAKDEWDGRKMRMNATKRVGMYKHTYLLLLLL